MSVLSTVGHVCVWAWLAPVGGPAEVRGLDISDLCHRRFLWFRSFVFSDRNTQRFSVGFDHHIHKYFCDVVTFDLNRSDGPFGTFRISFPTFFITQNSLCRAFRQHSMGMNSRQGFSETFRI